VLPSHDLQNLPVQTVVVSVGVSGTSTQLVIHLSGNGANQNLNDEGGTRNCELLFEERNVLTQYENGDAD